MGDCCFLGDLLSLSFLLPFAMHMLLFHDGSSAEGASFASSAVN